MTPEALYCDFIGCEEKSADLYLNLSVRFCDETALSWFWIDLAMGQKEVAGLVQYCVDCRVFADDLPDPLSIARLRDSLDVLDRRTLDPSLDLDHAFDIAIQVETSEIDAIRSKLTMPIEAPAYVLQKKRALSHPNRIQKLRLAAEQFEVSPTLRSRLSSLS